MVRLKAAARMQGGCGTVFQFHYGTIKSCGQMLIERLLLQDFNSTMVRLKEVVNTALTGGTSSFQFHYGTIKSLLWLEKDTLINNISIPLWYD